MHDTLSKAPKWVFPYERTMFSQEYKPTILKKHFNNGFFFLPNESIASYSITGRTLVQITPSWLDFFIYFYRVF